MERGRYDNFQTSTFKQMDKDILVIKVGSSTLTGSTDKISRGKIEDIARQLVALQEEYGIILVSSGAIATARQFFNTIAFEKGTASKQALSAIGQPKLMQIYNEVFGDYGIRTAQCLLTYSDFGEDRSKENTLNTLLELLKHGYVPIVNENDTVAVEEILMGDNDTLSAKVATLVSAKTLILASDVSGLYDKNPHLHEEAVLIPLVTDFTEVEQYIEERKDGIGRGGMSSKLASAKVCIEQGIECIITNGMQADFILGCVKGSTACTRFRKA